MALDAKRLMRDAKLAQADRPGTAIGRETTGVTRAVRESVSVIRRLRAAGVSWKAIAQAMTAQGITQSGGEALTATRLTAIFSQVEARMGRPALDLARRERRSDLAPRAGETGPGASTASLADRMPDQPSDALQPGRPATEAEIRRAGLAELRKILRRE